MDGRKPSRVHLEMDSFTISSNLLKHMNMETCCEYFCDTDVIIIHFPSFSPPRAIIFSHLNKTTTYERPQRYGYDVSPPEPRKVVLQRSPTLGFGFVAGSEKPVIVRFVTEGGPSVGKVINKLNFRGMMIKYVTGEMGFQ